MSIRVILMTGVYDTLDIFTYELRQEFINMGLEVMEFNTKDMKESLYSLMKFHFGAAAGGRIGHCVGRRSINRVNKQRSYEKRAIFKSALFLFVEKNETETGQTKQFYLHVM